MGTTGRRRLATTLAATSALAGKNDYVFEPVAAEVKNGDGSQLAVRLTHKASGKPVEGAVIFRTRLVLGIAGCSKSCSS
jgi:hypothetical protein